MKKLGMIGFDAHVGEVADRISDRFTMKVSEPMAFEIKANYSG